jgi:hypothetical protein
MTDPTSPTTLNSHQKYLVQRVRFTGTTENTHCDLTQLLASDWPRPRKVFEFHIWGKCPSCHHESEGLFSLYTATGLTEGGPSVAPSDSAHAIQRAAQQGQTQALGVQRCACVRNHHGAPTAPAAAPAADDAAAAASAPSPPAAAPSASTFGCRASWLVGVRYDPHKPDDDIAFFTPTGQLEAEFWQSAEAMADDAPNALSTIQTAAKGWSTALAAIVALVSLSSIIGGRATLATLSTTTQWTLISLSGLSLVTAAVALYLSALANLGMPSLKRVSSPTRIRDNDLGPLHKAAHAARSLRLATVFTALAFLAALAALGIFVQAPAAPAAVATNKITISGVITAKCGSIAVYSTDPRLIAFTPKGAASPTHVVRATRLTDIGPAC